MGKVRRATVVMELVDAGGGLDVRLRMRPNWLRAR